MFHRSYKQYHSLFCLMKESTSGMVRWLEDTCITGNVDSPVKWHKSRFTLWPWAIAVSGQPLSPLPQSHNTPGRGLVVFSGVLA